ncbi:MAG: hypothetical protein WDZ70_02840 [Candidatus Paceibacterota bacterium]
MMNNMKTFNIQQLFKDTWKLFEKHILVLLGAYIAVALIIGGSGLLMDEQSIANIPAMILLTLLIWLIAAIFAVGIIQILLDIVEGKDPKIETLWSRGELVPGYVGLQILVAVIVFLGLFLFIFPAFIFWITFSFASFAFVHRGGGILESMVDSKNITKGHKWNLLLIFIFLIILNMAGAALFGVGLILTVPFSHLMVALLYTKLRDTSNA